MNKKQKKYDNIFSRFNEALSEVDVRNPFLPVIEAVLFMKMSKDIMEVHSDGGQGDSLEPMEGENP